MACEGSEAIDYFAHQLPRIKQSEGQSDRIIECIQKPGDTIFVPGGWWHAVLNLDDTMAVTQNYCSLANFRMVWRAMRIERRKLSVYFLHKLKTCNKELYKMAMQMNRADRFISKTKRKTGHFLNNISTDSYTDSSSSSSSDSFSDSEEHES